MLLYQSRIPHYLCALSAICFAILYAFSSTAAEEELTLLTIEGDLVGKVESLSEDTDATQLISTYYTLIPIAAQMQVDILRRQLVNLMPDYKVAFTAADSAELANVVSDINTLWAAIQIIHTQYFTQEVIELLNKSYDKMIPFNSK